MSVLGNILWLICFGWTPALLWALAGLLCLWSALYIKNTAWACVVSVLGFTCLWSIKELFEQEKRVQKGWFAKNPKRK